MVANLEIKLLKTSSSNSSAASSIISPSTDSSSTNSAQPLSNGGFSNSDSSFADPPSSLASDTSAKAQRSVSAVLLSTTNLFIQEFLRKAMAGPQSTAVFKSDSDSSTALWDGFRDLFALSGTVTKSESSDTSSTWDGFRDLFAISIESLPETPGGGGHSANNVNDGAGPQTQTDSTDSSTSTNLISSSTATSITTTSGGGRTSNNNNHQNKTLDDLTDLSTFSSETLLVILSNVMVDLLKSQHEVKEKVSCEAQYCGIGKASSGPTADNASSSGAGMSTTLSSRSAVDGNNRKNTNFNYEVLDKLELRYAIAKAADFYEFVRIYSASGAEPTLSQIVRIAELLFKDYQNHVLHHELTSNA